jgi:hypothetical protein
MPQGSIGHEAQKGTFYVQWWIFFPANVTAKAHKLLQVITKLAIQRLRHSWSA